jgi:hypothetical protein
MMKRAIGIAALALGLVSACHENGSKSGAARPRAKRSAGEQEASVLLQMQLSGRADAPWNDEARAVLARWTPPSGVTLEPLRCFRAGCIVEVHHRDRDAYDAASAALPNVPGFLDYPGTRLRGGPHVQPDGSVLANWFFMRPDGPASEHGESGDKS